MLRLANVLRVSERRRQNLFDGTRDLGHQLISNSDTSVYNHRTKTFFNAERPTQGIQNSLIQDPSWRPMLVTPPNSEFSAGHTISVVGQAQPVS